MRISELINKVAGAGMLTLSAAFLALGGVGIYSQAMFPGLFFGLTGTVLLARREKTAALPADVAERLARLEAAVASTQQELVLAQEDLKEITEERNFLRQLRVSNASPTHSAPEQ